MTSLEVLVKFNDVHAQCISATRGPLYPLRRQVKARLLRWQLLAEGGIVRMGTGGRPDPLGYSASAESWADSTLECGCIMWLQSAPDDFDMWSHVQHESKWPILGRLLRPSQCFAAARLAWLDSIQTLGSPQLSSRVFLVP